MIAQLDGDPEFAELEIRGPHERMDLVSDSLTTAPARNAPRASETPKTAYET